MKQERKRLKKVEQNINELWDKTKWLKLEPQKRKGTKMWKNGDPSFLIFDKIYSPKIQVVQQTPNRGHQKKTTLNK